MTTSPTSVTMSQLDLPGIRRAVDARLDVFLTDKEHQAAGHRLPAEVTSVLRNFLFAAGKRLRPLLCVCGWYAGGGHRAQKGVLQAAAALEMFHAFALIHDDIMDHSDTRRGHPAIHRTLTTRHSQGRSTAAADHVGASAAILVGDLALAWSDELLHTAGLTPRQLTDILPLVDAMRTEVMYGQYLDLTSSGHPTDGLEHALAIIRYKTAKYTVERPLHIGAALAGAPPPLLAVLSAFALPLGDAFQLRDDLLGVFGDPTSTGKPNLDDLRAGKHTVLIALALQHASHARADQLRLLLGCPNLTEDQAEAARRIITATGAPAMVEEMITERYERAMASLETAPFAPAVAGALGSLADSAVRRHT
ncbi:polyprenyl synthetase family protein [Streptomyces olivoreticuli]